MASNTYDQIITLILKSEGGYTNDAADPGGPTNWGITIADARMYWKKTATAADVKAMPLSVAKIIYKAHYWDSQACNELPAGIDYAIMDYGVNSGIGRSGKVLRRALGLPDNTSTVTADVITACNKADPKKIINYICTERLAFLKSLSTWPTFGRGWGTRVASVFRVSLDMASAATVPAMGTSIQATPAPTQPSAKGVVPINKKAQGTSAATTTIGGSAAAAHAPSWEIAIAILIATALIGAGAYYFFVWKQKRDQEAPVKVALAT